jgi:hypothetical protein
MDERRLGIDTPLGVLTLEREGLSRYVFAEAKRPPDPGVSDEILLVDGTLLRGRLERTDGAWRLDHALLGEVTLPDSAVRAVRRAANGVVDLTAVRPLSVATQPLIAGPVRDDGLRVLGLDRDDEGEMGDPPFVRALRIEPETTVRYPFPTTPRGPLVLRVLLAPAGRSRGDVKVKLRSGERTVLEREISSETPSEWIEVELPVSEEVVLEARFGARLLFPCAMILGEPHLLLRTDDAVSGLGEAEQGDKP